MIDQGRIQSISAELRSLVLINERGTHTLSYAPERSDPIHAGEVVSVDENGKVQRLTPNRSGTTAWMKHVLNPRRQHGTRFRSRVEMGIREYFSSQGFLETRTPLLAPSPGMETHIRPFQVLPHHRDEPGRRPVFLPTSPEFAMKKLLTGGLERIFQICPAFRDEPDSVMHRPEFTMLEWYRAYAGYEEIMRDTEQLLESLAVKFFGKPILTYQGREISVAAPWPRLRVRDLFLEHAEVDLVRSSSALDLARESERLGLKVNLKRENWDDIYFKIWLNLIEPNLPKDRAVFVTRYPASQAALSVVDSDPDGSRWARRFEAYAGGLELGNAFEELTDPAEQRKRFEEDMKLRTEIYGEVFPPSPVDEEFLAALDEGMPPAGGIAVGVDRLVMLFANEPEIDYTFWL